MHDYPEVRKTALIWSKIAAQQINELPYLSKERELFSDNWATLQGISWILETPGQYDEFYVCTDKKKEPQGMLALKIEEDKIYIAYLATHPNNIRSSINEINSKRAKGAGSALLDWTEKLAYALDKTQVYLYASDSANPFFLKMGFIKGQSQMPNYMFKSIILRGCL